MMEIIKEDKPASWESVSLIDISNVRTGKKDANHETPNGKYRFYTCAYKHIKCDTKSFEGECLILPGNGANVGEIFYYNGEFEAYQRTYVIEKIQLLPKYLFYHLLANWKKTNSDKQYGSATNYIRIGNFENYIVKIPPTNEQRRIVAKIEELFSDLDKGVESLKLAQIQLKTYRQSILKHAFEGKLTAKWREENADKLETADELLAKIKFEREKHYEQQLKNWQQAVEQWEANGQEGKKPTKPRRQKTDELNPEHLQKMWECPKSWQWLQIGDFAFVTKLAGFEYTDYVKYDEDGDLPVIKAENAGLHGFKKTNYSKVHSNTVSHLNRSHLVGGELLVVFVGAGTGNVARVPTNQKFFLGPNIGMVRPESVIINSSYVELFLRSPFGKDLILASVKAVAQPSISMGTIRQTPVILPNPIEQQQIVSEIEAKFSVIDQLEKDIEENLKRSETLRQSILKKAFSGQLVAQDPNDEPASELLKRIKCEKVAQAPTKRKKRKSA